MIAGNLTFLCAVPLDSPYELVLNGTIQVASSIVKYPVCLTVDLVSGDIYWGGNSPKNRIIVLRAAGGTFRVGGNSE